MVIPASVVPPPPEETEPSGSARRAAPVRKPHGPLRTRPQLPTVGQRAWKPGLGRTCPDYLAGGADPEVLEKVSLPPGPGDELVQVP
jgi:hypothetical protein